MSEEAPPARRRLSGEGLRFLAAGGANTLFTLLLYWGLLRILDYRVAYTVAYLVGMATSYFLNSRLVFRTRPTVRSALAYPLVYVSQYLLGLAVVWAWVTRLGLPATYAALVAIVVTLPVTFFLSRLILRKLA